MKAIKIILLSLVFGNISTAQSQLPIDSVTNSNDSVHAQVKKEQASLNTETQQTSNVIFCSIKGQIIDAKTGETLPGALVVIEGMTNGAITDMDGRFAINNIPAGKYKVNFRLMSYKDKSAIVELVTKEPVIISISLEEGSTDLQEVEVVANVNKETSNTLLIMQKNSASVSDGISAESIKRTPDKSTSDVIKRVSGASIQDNKFAVIRGMNDRYNTAYINGAPLPSSEPDRRAFAFDIFPSNLIDNLIIVKTATPDLPGDFAGGVIQINTKSIPDENRQTFSITGGYNKLTTFHDFKTYEGGKTDWIGIDDGSRAMQKRLPGTKEYAQTTNEEKATYAQQSNNDWALQTKQAKPNLAMQYSIARSKKIFKRDAGLVFGITYSNTNNTSYAERNEFEEQAEEVNKVRGYVDTIFANNVLSSALLNTSYKLNDNNKIHLKNLFSINTDDKVTMRSGINDVPSLKWEKSTVRWFTQNVVYTGQLSGEHLFKNKKLKLTWNGGYSNIVRNVPNMRKMVYNKFTTNQDDSLPYFAQIQQNSVTTSSAGTMFYSKNNEKIYSGKLDVSYPFQIRKIKNELKVGAFSQVRQRSFDARLFGFTQYKKGTKLKFNQDLLLLPEDQIFAGENMGITQYPAPYTGGFKLSEATTPLDSYDAYSFLQAGYIMADSKIKEKFRFIYGARVESYNQKITNYDAISGEPVIRDTVVTDILPSVNAVWSATEKINVRAAYYRTVSRPEFRELANFNFYDFISDFSVAGNPNLQRALIDNYDVRFEYYPSAGQLISVSGFYKEIRNAIEQIASTASQIRSITYTNVPLVTNIGAELEYRVKLGQLLKKDSVRILQNMSLFTNVAFIKSTVHVGNVIGAKDRPLQGQSPLIINGGVSYNDLPWGFAASVSYNFIGKRIFIVGSVDEPDYWENPRHVIDIQLAKTIWKERIELKLNAKDILAQYVIFYQDINDNGKFDATVGESVGALQSRPLTSDNLMIKTKVAPVYSFSVSLKF